jgi:uncharacterized protein (TIGR02466 family)
MASSTTDLTDLDPVFIVAAQRVRLPDDLFAQLTEHVRSECANPDRKPYDEKLVGRISQGEQIHTRDHLPPMLKAWLCLCGRKYVLRMAELNKMDLNTDFRVSFADSWIVLSKAGDYNPLHHHPSSVVGVINVAIPPQVADSDSTDGKLSLVFGQSRVSNLDFLGDRTVQPVEGDMVLFPGWMNHTVYPFAGEGERITYAFNLTVSGLSDKR